MSENNGMISKSEVGGSVSYSEDVIAIISWRGKKFTTKQQTQTRLSCFIT